MFALEGRIVFAPERCAVRVAYAGGKLLLAFKPDPRGNDGLFVELPLAVGLSLWHQVTELFSELLPRRVHAEVVVTEAAEALPAGPNGALEAEAVPCAALNPGREGVAG